MPTRRTFLASGVAASAGATAWASLSSSWGARFLRERIARVRPGPARRAAHAHAGHLGRQRRHHRLAGACHGAHQLLRPAHPDRPDVLPADRRGRLGRHRRAAAAGAVRADARGPARTSTCCWSPTPTSTTSTRRRSPRCRAARRWSWPRDVRPAAATRHASVHELRWNETVRVRTPRGEAQVRAIEVRHWGARLQRDTWRGYGGFVVEREGRRLLIGGDTADTPLFRDHRRHGPFEAAVMPIGAYDPWIRQPLHARAGRDGWRTRQARGCSCPSTTSPSGSAGNRSSSRSSAPRRCCASERDRLALRAIGETVVLPA